MLYLDLFAEKYISVKSIKTYCKQWCFARRPNILLFAGQLIQ